jgi:hypothetical protein
MVGKHVPRPIGLLEYQLDRLLDRREKKDFLREFERFDRMVEHCLRIKKGEC